MGNLEAAGDAFDRLECLALDADQCAAVRLNRGLLGVAQGQCEAAALDFEAVQQLEPTNLTVHPHPHPHPHPRPHPHPHPTPPPHQVGENRTYTQCGTEEYVPPEMLKGRGRTRASDWCALTLTL